MPTLHLTDYDESERADYMVIVASMLGSGEPVTSEDIYAVRELTLRYVLGPTARGRVLSACSTPPSNLEEIVGHLEHSTLKHSLLLDMAVVATIKDGVIDEGEEQAIRHTADLLGITRAQVDALVDLARFLRGASKPDAASVERALADVTQAGVPAGALAVSATLHGLRNDEHQLVREALRAAR